MSTVDTSTLEPIVVKQSAKGTALYLCGAIFMSVVSVCLLFGNFSPSHGLLRSLYESPVGNVMLKFMFALGAVFFGLCCFFLLKRAGARKHILVVDETGITDHSNMFSFGFTPWSDIDKIYLDSGMNNTFIELVLHAEEKHLQSLNAFQRKLLLATKKMGHQMVCITLNSTGITPESIMPRILDFYKAAKKA